MKPGYITNITSGREAQGRNKKKRYKENERADPRISSHFLAAAAQKSTFHLMDSVRVVRDSSLRPAEKPIEQ